MADVSVPVCGVCVKNVSESDKAILCEGFCGKWCHMGCVKVIKTQYDMINKLGDEVMWFCPGCKVNMNLIVSKVKDPCELLDLNNLINRMFEVVKGLAVDNLEINTKLDKVISENCRLKDHVFTSIPDVDENCASQVAPIPKKFKGDEGIDHCTVDTNLRSSSNRLEDSHNRSTDSISEKSETLAAADVEVTILVTDDKISETNLINDYSEKTVNVNKVEKVNVAQCENGTSAELKTSFVDIVKKARKPNNNKPIIGSNLSRPGLKTVGRTEWIFVSRFDPDTTVGDVREYLKDFKNGLEKSKCEEVKSRYNTYKSFKVGVPENLVDAALDPACWPHGTFVKIYETSRFSRSAKYERKPFLENSEGLRVQP